jgi:hypothetical protein
MAQPTAAIATKSKDHRRRKNPGAAEFFAKQRKAKNAERPKQRWVEAAVDTGKDTSPIEGYWTREAM